MPSKFKLIGGGLLAVLVVLIALFGSQSGAPPAPVRPPAAAVAPGGPQSAAPTNTVPNFGNGGSTGATGGSAAGASKPPSASSSTAAKINLQDAQKIQHEEKRAAAAQPIMQDLPVTKEGVILDVGSFGSASRPGVQVTYAGTLAHAKLVAAQLFSQYGDHLSHYELQYTPSVG